MLLKEIGPVMRSRMVLCSVMTVSSSAGSNSSSGPYTDSPGFMKSSFCLPLLGGLSSPAATTCANTAFEI